MNFVVDKTHFREKVSFFFVFVIAHPISLIVYNAADGVGEGTVAHHVVVTRIVVGGEAIGSREVGIAHEEVVDVFG